MAITKRPTKILLLNFDVISFGFCFRKSDNFENTKPSILV